MYRAMINRLSIILIIFILGFQNPDHPDVQSNYSLLTSFEHGASNSEKIKIDLEKSIVEWKGTKLMGAGSHSGYVIFDSGYLLMSKDTLVGGKFVVDMTTIHNTDIPLSDPIPRRNIISHLNSDFETKNFPTSKFIIRNVSRGQDEYSIEGDLTIKGIQRTISAPVKQLSQNTFKASFTLIRSDWKIGERGSWLEKKLVDPTIYLMVTIVLSPG